VLEQRRETGGRGLGEAQKRLVLQSLRDSGSIDYTRDTLRSLQTRIEESIAGLERCTGRENWVLRLCMQMLSV
jgi:geranylgeranyl pyrophosphate synthase